MGDYPKRARLVLLLKFFQDQTDEYHPKQLCDMLDYLKREGIEVERKSLYADLALLRDLGFDIIKTTNKGKVAYFLGERPLELAEAQVCASAVSASRFITERKSSELVRKLGDLFGQSQSAQFCNRLELARTQKTRNEEIYYNIDRIVHAQSLGKKISFLYFEYLPDKTQRLKRQGQRYIVSPYSLMWFEDAYYLVCNIDKYNNLTHFRVDRMTRVDIEEEDQRPVDEVSEYRNYIDFDDYHKSVFSMFGGKRQNVRIRFRNELATPVFDRFGLDVDVSDIHDGCFTVSVNVRVSQGFIAWLTLFGEKAEVLAPKSLREQIAEWLAPLRRVYEK